MEEAGTLNEKMREVLAYGTVSAEDAAVFNVYCQMKTRDMPSLKEIISNPALLPNGKDNDTRAWRCSILQGIRSLVEKDSFTQKLGEFSPDQLNDFMMGLDAEERVMLLMGCVAKWGRLGADETLIKEFNNLIGNLL